MILMTAQGNPAISTFKLSKNFGLVSAVNEVTLAINPGEIYALVGPNGAGKTTLLKLLVGLLAPTSGNAVIYGHDIAEEPIEAKKMFAFISDDPKAYNYLTGREFLSLTANLRQIPAKTAEERIEKLKALFPISDIIDQRMAHYSRGNRQKLAFLAGLLAQPKIFIIDEPIVGLDPASIKIFGQKLRGFAKEGGTVLFSTHILKFAKDFAQRIGFMVNGRIEKETLLVDDTQIDDLYQKITEQAV